MACLAVATSRDLVTWKKHGFVFKSMERFWSKSGSIVCRIEGDRMVAEKINGFYWMYFGEGNIYVAWSKDLISWETNLEDMLLTPRSGKFDSELVEPGPQGNVFVCSIALFFVNVLEAFILDGQIVLLYNGKNSKDDGDSNIPEGAYSAGKITMSLQDPKKLLTRSETHFLTPEKSWEMKGQYFGGTVFIEGLIYFKNRFFLYYGAADSMVGVAIGIQTRDEL